MNHRTMLKTDQPLTAGDNVYEDAWDGEEDAIHTSVLMMIVRPCCPLVGRYGVAATAMRRLESASQDEKANSYALAQAFGFGLESIQRIGSKA